MSEIWDLVDKEGKKTGKTWARINRHSIPEGCYHPCVEVWIKVGKKLLITQRHPDKSEGLMYDSPGGAVLSGEDFIEGAIRELFEEVGILTSTEELRYLGAYLGQKAYAVSYLLCLDSIPKITLQPTEVVGYKLVTENELEKMSNQLCEGCRKRFLNFKSEIFQKK